MTPALTLRKSTLGARVRGAPSLTGRLWGAARGSRSSPKAPPPLIPREGPCRRLRNSGGQNSQFTPGRGPRGRENARNWGDGHSRASPGNGERTYRKEWNHLAEEEKAWGAGGRLGARRRGLSLILTGTVAAGEDGVKGMDSPKSEDPPNFRYL